MNFDINELELLREIVREMDQELTKLELEVIQLRDEIKVLGNLYIKSQNLKQRKKKNE